MFDYLQTEREKAFFENNREMSQQVDELFKNKKNPQVEKTLKEFISQFALYFQNIIFDTLKMSTKGILM